MVRNQVDRPMDQKDKPRDQKLAREQNQGSKGAAKIWESEVWVKNPGKSLVSKSQNAEVNRQEMQDRNIKKLFNKSILKLRTSTCFSRSCHPMFPGFIQITFLCFF